MDCLKFWFDKKHKFIELKLEDKADFKHKNLKTKETFCCLCDFPIESRVKNGWREHMFKAEYLFLENIYSEKQTKLIGIDNFETYSKKLDKILDKLNSFSECIDSENLSLSKVAEQDREIESIIEEIKKKPSREDERKATKEKNNSLFVSARCLVFYRQTKLREIFQYLKKILLNMISISKNKKVIHHSHVTGKVIGYAHDFCNERAIITQYLYLHIISSYLIYFYF